MGLVLLFGVLTAAFAAVAADAGLAGRWVIAAGAAVIAAWLASLAWAALRRIRR